MKVVGLVSGGKDSCYAMMKCMQYGHQIVALANLLPMDDSIDELDSFMYQTVGHQIVVGYAECMGLPLFRRRIHGSTRHQKLSYQTTLGDEVEDMLILLSEVKRQIPSVMAVSSGALASDYQRLRVESVCSRLGLVSLAYLWKQDQSLLLQEMISNGISAIMVKVAAIGLDPAKHLGKEISYLQSHLHQLKELYGINVCGEGGEYETLTLDCPLFTNARIVLDDFEVVLHSPDEIASVGVLHPSAFHLEHKKEIASFSNNSLNNVSNEMGSVSEVQGDFILTNKDKREPLVLASDLVVGAEAEVHISKTKHKNAISMGCWIHDPCEASDGLQKDLAILLKRIESELTKDGYGWVNVLYVHLYIADMNEFALANETYVTFITEEKCHLGVPSRSTIEIPLSQVGLGKAYIEVLIADDQSKQVLHVQSISCWAPSCIGPYSQATLHKEVLYMAGQLGLDPPTMKLCCGGVTAELDQALENCEAVTRSFKCSLASSTVLFVVYCSAALTCPQKLEIQDKFEAFLEQRQVSDLVNRDMSKSFEPIFLYVLAPDLPKSALVEVKPILFVPEDTEIEFEDTDEDTETEIASDTQDSLCTTFPSSWNFENVPCGSSCLQKYIIQNKICVVTLSVMNQQAAKICFDPSVSDPAHVDHKYFATEKHMKQVARFCIYLLDKTLMENYFSWGDVMSLRFYYSTSLEMPLEVLSLVLIDVFNEFAEMSKKISSGTEPMFNLIPVLGAGKSASSMDDLITCELFSSKANNC